MSELQIKLMHREALKRLHDAERLDTDMVNSVLSDPATYLIYWRSNYY